MVPGFVRNVGMNSVKALAFLVQARGNINLAAERAGVNPAILVSALAEDIAIVDTLSNQLRVLAIIRTYELLEYTTAVALQALPDLSPYESVKAFTGLAAALSRLTPPPLTINLQETLFKMLPPSVREAVLELTNGSSTDAS